MKKSRLGTNDWGTDDRGDEQDFFDSRVTRDERENNAAPAWRGALRQGSFEPASEASPTDGASRLLCVAHAHRDGGTELHNGAARRALMRHPGGRREVCAIELGKQVGGDDFVACFCPKKRYAVGHGHRHPRPDPTLHL